MRRHFTLFILLGACIGILVLQSSCAGTGELAPEGEIIYDIRGSWNVHYSSYVHFVCTFQGTEKEGVVTTADGDTGKYKVGGNLGIQVKFDFMYRGSSYFYFEGQFRDADFMDGTTGGSWGATRIISE